MHLAVFPAFTLLGLSLAKKHDYCACQYTTDSPVDYGATDLLAGDCGLDYVYGQDSGQFWSAEPPGEGARFQGRFLKASAGQIDGDEFYNNCKGAGANDATCFDCDSKFEYPDGHLQCAS
ncbi:hypothetical protein CORC01_01713 [Colletotrichum orchidophilum]|uniref:Uncharacterized protein n=1 Tax=Colletotrichum orchidophilum TaxID=1209926 RepID=A0A1G4BNQ6_9PEZI|nr:uncharacterized protein CORC01_01713 [Colletotrichum orchidophilum]OHF02955.1 hypothetical protein CORC01_01713 [Colletotrichum orchidophilum]